MQISAGMSSRSKLPDGQLLLRCADEQMVQKSLRDASGANQTPSGPWANRPNCHDA